ncbi:hypothetical protein K458DRAFT_388772 [Lentithecium fluviatile CBS 122367]|uniref:Protein kinase domain-containing protein n=1 Tax=Lentithecium fluviatile CBS 122367 TaxID=1168545 RepID=A0A6G1J246_9PLEO|nr:hypothetical protein K458DRAFT_388772 [Lentithecium fluviatile CBS 122367]
MAQIAYARYTTTLFYFVVNSPVPLFPNHHRHIVSNIRAGPDCLHILDLVHYNIRPENIFVRGLESGRLEGLEVVIGDFDSTKRVGVLLVGKSAPEECWPKSLRLMVDTAQVGIDEWCLERFEEWFEGWRMVHEIQNGRP